MTNDQNDSQADGHMAEGDAPVGNPRIRHIMDLVAALTDDELGDFALELFGTFIGRARSAGWDKDAGVALGAPADIMAVVRDLMGSAAAIVDPAQLDIHAQLRAHPDVVGVTEVHSAADVEAFLARGARREWQPQEGERTRGR